MWHLKFFMSKLKRLKSNVLGDEDDLSSVMGVDFDIIDTWDDRHEDATDDLVLLPAAADCDCDEDKHEVKGLCPWDAMLVPAAAGGWDRDGACLNCGWCNCGGGGGGMTCCCPAIRHS